MRRLLHNPKIDLATGELFPPSCGANFCPYCAGVKRRKITRAVGAAEPTAMLTMTLAGDEWPVITRQMRNLRRRLLRHNYAHQWVWVVECNRKGDWHRHHVHALAHGNLPGDGTFTEFAQQAGFGRESRVERPLVSVAASVQYLWGRSKRQRDDLAHFLEVNGNRFEHSSKGFWRVNGVSVPGWEAAWKALRDG